jgi:hypothetical protein
MAVRRKLIVIGNGFDLHHLNGIKPDTSYHSFANFLKDRKRELLDFLCEFFTFPDDLRDKIWGGFELNLGNFRPSPFLKIIASFLTILTRISRSDYWDALDEAIDAEREAHGQKPMKLKEREAEIKESKISRPDPDSGYMVRDGKPKGKCACSLSFQRQEQHFYRLLAHQHTTGARSVDI